VPRPLRVLEGDVGTARLDEVEAIEPQHARCCAHVCFGRLDVERVARASAVVRQRDAAGEVLVEDPDRLFALDAPVVVAVRKADEVAGEAVAADVRALPDRLLFELLRERLEQRAPVPGAAGVVLAVRADQEERLRDRVARGGEVERAQVVVRLERETAELLLALARRRRERAQLGAAAPVRSADEEQSRVLPRT
jgi:hypothetical protein